MRNKRKQRESVIRSKEMITLTYVFTILFLCLIGYLIYYQVQISADVVNSPYNRNRQNILAQQVVRGSIFSSDGKTLAKTTVNEEGAEVREYPYDNLFSHVVGYSVNGGSGIEAYNNVRLLQSGVPFTERLENALDEQKNAGNNVITTLNYSLQSAVYDAMGSHEGAVVVMEPDTGKILAMVSKPDYNPNRIEEMWEDLIAEDSTDTVLLNRATQGLYPPGSTFKMITALEYMRENSGYEAYEYECSGSHEYDSNIINCFHSTVHGKENLKESFSHSCNSSFVNIGMTLNRKKLKSLCEDLFFNKDISIGIASKASRYSADNETSTYKMMQTVIGQGDTLVTPLQMAMVTSAIANDGKMMKPYLVDRIENVYGKTIKSFRPKTLAKPLSEDECKKMTELMEAVVDDGTATKLNTDAYNVAGKTGSAEFGSEKGRSHAWFVGFSEEEDSIVVSILLEDGGTGGSSAAPVAKKIFDAYYN